MFLLFTSFILFEECKLATGAGIWLECLQCGKCLQAKQSSSRCCDSMISLHRCISYQLNYKFAVQLSMHRASVHQNPYLSNPFVAKNRILYFRARLIRINLSSCHIYLNHEYTNAEYVFRQPPSRNFYCSGQLEIYILYVQT